MPLCACSHGKFAPFSHVQATRSISSTVSSFSLGFPLDSPLFTSTLSIFSQSEKVTGFTPTEEKMLITFGSVGAQWELSGSSAGAQWELSG